MCTTTEGRQQPWRVASRRWLIRKHRVAGVCETRGDRKIASLRSLVVLDHAFWWQGDQTLAFKVEDLSDEMLELFVIVTAHKGLPGRDLA